MLSKSGATIDRDSWIKEAQDAEKSGSVMTCRAIIKSTLELGVEESDRKSTFIEDAENCVSSKFIETARAIYNHLVTIFSHKKGVWRRAVMFEKEHGDFQRVNDLLRRAVEFCPHAPILWLMAAKEMWVSGDVETARGILEEAFKANKDSQEIWLAAIKLEVETGNYEKGRNLLTTARENVDSAKVWIKSAVLERQLGNLDQALLILDQALTKFPTEAKLWMIKGQIQGSSKNYIGARDTFIKAIKNCPNSITLYLLASRLEEEAGILTKARPILERGRLLHSKNDMLWCESIRLENRHGNSMAAMSLLSRGLQECPESGLLWSEAIILEPRTTRRSKCADAIKKCETSPLVFCTVARIFWNDGKVDKARNWFNKAVTLDVDLGDSWAWLVKFERSVGGDVAGLLTRCTASEPRHGEVWQIVSKDVGNVGLSTLQVLEKVIEKLPEKI